MMLTYPQLTVDDALIELERLEDTLRDGRPPGFLIDGELHPRTRFPGFNPPASAVRLRQLHDRVASALEGLPGRGHDAARRFDIVVGRVLTEWFEEEGRNQASTPQIWAYIALLVMPDLAIRRFGPDKRGRLPRERYLAGRRNLFYRAYLRAWILGDLLEDPELPLYEDDLVGLVDRNLSADHRVSKLVAEQIRSTPAGEMRRETVREGLKNLQYELRVSDLSSLPDADAEAVVVESFRVRLVKF